VIFRQGLSGSARNEVALAGQINAATRAQYLLSSSYNNTIESILISALQKCPYL